jgi:arylsulfatase A-like enzyme
MDDAVGQVLDELDRLGLRDSTLVIFHADHGWGLGEANLWHKFTNYEASVRVPLIVRAPWLLRRGPNPPAGAPGGLLAPGSTVSTPIELVDIYPTAVRFLLCTVTFCANHAHNLTRSP